MFEFGVATATGTYIYKYIYIHIGQYRSWITGVYIVTIWIAALDYNCMCNGIIIITIIIYINQYELSRQCGAGGYVDLKINLFKIIGKISLTPDFIELLHNSMYT